MSPIPIITLFFAIITFVVVMLLPAIIELKRPKDPGPRMILEKTPYMVNLQFSLDLPSLEIDESMKISPESIDGMAKALAALPVLEV